MRQRAGAISDADTDSSAVSLFVAFVLGVVCGLDAFIGTWTRGSNRKGQAELSEVLDERVREAVEILIRGHGEALSALAERPDEADIAKYRAYPEDVAGVSSAEAPFGEDETLSW